MYLGVMTSTFQYPLGWTQQFLGSSSYIHVIGRPDPVENISLVTMLFMMTH